MYNSGLRTQPCGAPVLKIMGWEVCVFILTTCGLLVRKLRIQLHIDVLNQITDSFPISVCGMIVLNAELKSVNSILTYEFLFSRCERAW